MERSEQPFRIPCLYFVHTRIYSINSLFLVFLSRPIDHSALVSPC